MSLTALDMKAQFSAGWTQEISATTGLIRSFAVWPETVKVDRSQTPARAQALVEGRIECAVIR
jgi:hypothetical protein